MSGGLGSCWVKIITVWPDLPKRYRDSPKFFWFRIKIYIELTRKFCNTCIVVCIMHIAPLSILLPQHIHIYNKQKQTRSTTMEIRERTEYQNSMLLWVLTQLLIKHLWSQRCVFSLDSSSGREKREFTMYIW